ncbi:MAG: hypothetical protein MUP47_08210 [Phycisphaerae bacterium]|nr:hypothetical protein [Phycisphaerae bacterium]
MRTDSLRRATSLLFQLSESRGKEAAGLALRVDGAMTVFKRAVAASRMVASAEYARLFEGGPLNQCARPGGGLAGPLSLVGHSRLVTNGRQSLDVNNQPVVKDGLVAVHNGIITNDARLWQKFPTLQQNYQVDTEVLLSLLRMFQREWGSWVAACQATFQQMEGTASVAVLVEDSDQLLLATNNGSLYFTVNQEAGLLFFASERHILEVFSERWRPRGGGLRRPDITHLAAGRGLLAGLHDLRLEEFRLDAPPAAGPATAVGTVRVAIVDLSAQDERARASLRRCTRCILPETMPFIEFDEQGVCSYCRTYRKIEVRGREALERELAPCRKGNGEPDCLVMLSGGRDSSYGLHYARRVLGLNPIAYSYDWGMITDLARRNQARLCGKLGVEHILVSADIPRKRRYVRRNVEAWLKRPHLGMVPLFMAGDKQYFYYVKQVMKHANVQLIIVCESPLERTRFKSGFSGVNEGTGRIFNLPLWKKLRILGFYLGQYLRNPAYINASLFDSFFAYASAYLMHHDFCFLYNYVPWDEQEIVSTLRREYDWELATDTPSTWRIGDGTAPFYNYIYYTVAGFTENDTFRSNQIREGVLTREQALELVRRENQPRWDALQWYAQTIGFDLDEALNVIHSMPKLYGPR